RHHHYPPPPWPQEFIKARRAAYLRAGPDFQLAKMAPRPLDLGPIAKLSNISMLPFRKMIFVWFMLVLLFVALFVVTHNSEQNQHLLNQFLTWLRNLFH